MNRRAASGILGAFSNRENYVAALNTFRFIERPRQTLRAYFTLADGGYPRRFSVRTPTGHHDMTLYSADDLITLIECFARLDYKTDTAIRCVVDFGSNIGISALYFLSRNETSRVYLFEPLPTNIDRLETNLASFKGRYELARCAIGTAAGQADFGIEPTGRYGGLGLPLEESISVEVKGANAALRAVLATEGTIDVLKLDVEGMEVAILSHLSADVLARINVIYAETFGAGPVLPGFKKQQRGAIVVYRR